MIQENYDVVFTDFYLTLTNFLTSALGLGNKVGISSNKMLPQSFLSWTSKIGPVGRHKIRFHLKNVLTKSSKMIMV